MNLIIILVHLSSQSQYYRSAQEVMSPVLLYQPVMSDVSVGGTAVEVESFHQYAIRFCCQARESSREAV